MEDRDDSASAAPRRRRIVRAPQDLAAGATLVAIALLALWASAGLEGGSRGAMGPGTLPRLLAALLALSGAVLVALSLLRPGEALQRWSLRGPFFVVLAVVGFALTIRTFGLAVAGPAVVLVGGAASPEVRFKELALFALVITAFCIGLFRYVLQLPMPILIIPGRLVL